MNTIPEIAIRLYGDNEPCRCGGAHQVCLHCYKCRADGEDQTEVPNIAEIIDATVLKATANEAEVIDLCSMANEYNTASVCINSQFIPLIIKTLNPKVKSCTVINFPLGASSAEVIAAETQAVLSAGVKEVDMVQNLSSMLSGDYDTAYISINGSAKLCLSAGALLKVILETCYLSEEQIIISCLIAKKAGAHFVKTSTGFGTAGATAENIALMRSVVGPKLGVKASGGIRNREQALAMVAAGANRIGASSVKALL
ncbi:MAG: deoxyribose-phosphate aldolase [Candidatus Cloacimonetes bacterium HGW-Cloacimonetes-3]|jgi:deoxyribose-phosphate aldolase|nr:MAG: deoxyribose-phosphate aldolase [Candidatus Cloacimonetes bacterium HGW-Cloacimonetes-3]